MHCGERTEGMGLRLTERQALARNIGRGRRWTRVCAVRIKSEEAQKTSPLGRSHQYRVTAHSVGRAVNGLSDMTYSQ